jgi:uncharacterized protein with GYD domain
MAGISELFGGAISRDYTGWLTWQDSNRRMANSKKGFDTSGEIWAIYWTFGARDFFAH